MYPKPPKKKRTPHRIRHAWICLFDAWKKGLKEILQYPKWWFGLMVIYPMVKSVKNHHLKKQTNPWASTTIKIMVDPIWMIKTLR